MAKFSSKRRFDHSIDLIFNLMNDFEAHPNFLPLCKRTKVVSNDNTSESVESSIVRYVLAYQRYAFRKTLELLVHSDFDNYTMTLTGNNKDSRSVRIELRLTPAPDGGCEVQINGQYKLSDLTMAMADKSGMISKAFEKVMSAMDRQARMISAQ